MARFRNLLSGIVLFRSITLLFGGSSGFGLMHAGSEPIKAISMTEKSVPTHASTPKALSLLLALVSFHISAVPSYFKQLPKSSPGLMGP
jgi:hypothetical protein